MVDVYAACYDVLFKLINIVKQLHFSAIIVCDYYEIKQNSSKTLTHLNLSHYKITSIELDCWPKLSSLTHLSLSDCKTTIPNGFLSSLVKLQDLDLTYNTIANINDLKNLRSLKYLYLTYCDIQELEEHFFANLEELENLSLIGNHINFKSDHFKGLKSLTELSLDYCSIQSIDQILCSDLANLKDLYLAGNNIRNMEPKSFSSFKKLKTLKFSGNQLTFNDGQPISHDEFTRLIKDLINKDLQVDFNQQILNQNN